MSFSWNSTHTAIVALASVVISGMQYGVNLLELIPVIAPLSVYIGAREVSRIKSESSLGN
jgi:hypothetical protein